MQRILCWLTKLYCAFAFILYVCQLCQGRAETDEQNHGTKNYRKWFITCPFTGRVNRVTATVPDAGTRSSTPSILVALRHIIS